MISIKIATAYLAAMLPVAPTKDICFYLNGVYLNAHDKRLEATNGFVALMINYPLPDELTNNIILPTAFVADCVKVAKLTKQDFITIEYNPADGGLKTPSHSSGVLDWRFPKLDRIIPQVYDQIPRCVDTQFINMFHQVMKPLVAVHDGERRGKAKTPIVWLPEYGLTNGGNGCAVMRWKDITFIAMEMKRPEDAMFQTADVLARLDK